MRAEQPWASREGNPSASEGALALLSQTLPGSGQLLRRLALIKYPDEMAGEQRAGFL